MGICLNGLHCKAEKEFNLKDKNALTLLVLEIANLEVINPIYLSEELNG